MAKVHAVLVPASEHSLVKVDLEYEASLRNVQTAVGGYVEMIRMTDVQRAALIEEMGPFMAIAFKGQALNLKKAQLFVNEDGISKDLEVNEAISEIMGQRIVGDVIVTVME